MPKRLEDLPEDYFVGRRALAQAIGARVRVCREALDITQEQLRARLELEGVFVSRTQYSRIEQGEALPDAAELIAFHTIFEVPFDWLLLGDRDTSS